MGLLPFYLFCGPELGEKNEAIEKLRIQARKKLGQLDEHLFYSFETPLSNVMDLLLNESLFASARFIVLNGAEQIKKKEDLELISSWIRSASNSVETASYFVLVTDENSCDKKLEDLIPKENKRVFWEMFENRKEQWVRDFFKKNGYLVSSEAVELILDLVENNTEALKTECSRFFLCFDKGHEITLENVHSLLTHNREESAFTLFDAMADDSANPKARLESSLEILNKLTLTKGASGVQLIAGLTYCFRRLQIWHEIFMKNPYPSDFDLKTKGFASKKAQSQYRKAASIWDSVDTSRICANLANTDMNLRQRGSFGEETALQLLIYSIVMKKGFPLQKWA